MKVALFANAQKEEHLKLLKVALDFLHSHEISVFVQDEISSSLSAQPLSSIAFTELDALISLGGDGTILRTLHEFPAPSIPIMGINLGRLGFLADVPVQELKIRLKQLIKREFIIEKRLVLEGCCENKNGFFAVNDITIHRAQIPSLIELSVFVDEVYVNTFSADGIILSTPTGSTAYSLAAGGPIVDPNLNAIVITPICPHTITNRPIVLLPNKSIKIKYLSNYTPVEVTFDGFTRHTISSQEILFVRPSALHCSMIKFPDSDYFRTLRSKLGWSGQACLQNSVHTETE